MVGKITTYAVHPDGREEIIEEGNNLVVNSAYIAVAMAMKKDPSFDGFMWWALGDGNTTDSVAWDAGVADGSIKPAATDTKLAREVFRKEIDPAMIEFLDSNGGVTTTPTNKLRITVVFLESEPSSTQSTFLREWGIFGGNASATAETGFLINRKVHKTYEKTPYVQLKRVLEFTF